MTVYAVLPEASGFSTATPSAVSMAGVYLFTAGRGRIDLPLPAHVSTLRLRLRLSARRLRRLVGMSARTRARASRSADRSPGEAGRRAEMLTSAGMEGGL